MADEQAGDQPAAAPPSPPLEREASWLWQNRLRLALGIAIFEGIVVFFEKDFSRVTVIVIAIPIILFYLLAGRTLESRTGREVSWVLATSQAFAVLAAIVAILVPWIALAVVAVFAGVALYLLLHDRPDRAGSEAK